MSDQERFDQLSKLAETQRAIVHRLYDEWSAACKVLNDFEREQSRLFRKMMDGPALTSGDRKSKA
jgi:hypothetical protein